MLAKRRKVGEKMRVHPVRYTGHLPRGPGMTRLASCLRKEKKIFKSKKIRMVRGHVKHQCINLYKIKEKGTTGGEVTDIRKQQTRNGTVKGDVF